MVLWDIANYLKKLYEAQRHVSALLYFHRISDNSTGGLLPRHIMLLRQICGDKALQKVSIVTTMWNLVRGDVGWRRIEEIYAETSPFHPLIELGVTVEQYDCTLESAYRIVDRHLCSPKEIPMPLKIQSETVDEGLPLGITSAGLELTGDFDELVKHLLWEICQRYGRMMYQTSLKKQRSL
ncbi:hypothetical protein CPB86DRAFT_788023 [Serendipita vermifera]|nr:hypothetical protein CPB86DRAFT_788023 [Serendipita vermifera]